jgi:formamidopyrimidine-DNA glycosylase
MRKFASVEIKPTDLIETHLSLGPDSLMITKKEFAKKVSGRKNCPIKSALMDQKIIAGLGNIYSDEILWEVGVHPLSLANKIPPAKFEEMYKVMIKILNFSIKHGGDSKSDYRNVFGEKGGFQNFHKSYGKKGEKCPKRGCGGIIERKIVRGRSAHFCPKHQIIYK